MRLCSRPLLLCCLFLAASCLPEAARAQSPTPTIAPTPQASPSACASPAPDADPDDSGLTCDEPTPTETPTATPSESPSPSPSESPTPEESPSPSGSPDPYASPDSSGGFTAAAAAPGAGNPPPPPPVPFPPASSRCGLGCMATCKKWSSLGHDYCKSLCCTWNCTAMLDHCNSLDSDTIEHDDCLWIFDRMGCQAAMFPQPPLDPDEED